ncbi:MAG: hypothetical protein BIFFINMI_02592 [Phycisphaerae bacterium]|nr:hypothetical protein [Phycisphaerae bacterium]
MKAKPLAAIGPGARLLLAFVGLAAGLNAGVSLADGPALPEWQLRREPVYEFATPPAATRDGDRVTIRFATKALCDVTVAIEDGRGRTIRHLATGVLGPTAPAPLVRESREQTLHWDGKNDKGVYVDDPSACTVRVSLGLQPRFERSLADAPLKPVCYRSDGQLLAAAPEGVYVFQYGAGVSFLRLFDHDGNYVRTIYPFPSDRIDKVRGIIRRTFPQTGLEYPAKFGLNQNTLLTSEGLDVGVGWPDSSGGSPATAIAVRGGRIALVHQRLNRLSSDGDTGGAELTGARTSFDIPMSTMHTFVGGIYQAYPRSAALSPDGRTLYIAGYHYSNPWRLDALNGVAKVAWDAGRDAKAEVFAGSMTRGGAGAGDDRFDFPTSVACDATGRVYVTDYLNDRVQVFDPSGKLLKSLKASKPVQVAIDHRTGEIYLFSWWYRNSRMDARAAELAEKQRVRLTVPATVTRLASLEDPKVTLQCPLPLPEAPTSSEFGYKDEYFQVALDSWAPQPTLWTLAPPNYRSERWELYLPQIYELRDGKFALKRDFAREVIARTGRLIPPRHGRVRTFADQANGKVYLGESHTLNAKSFDDLVAIDPTAGKCSVVQMPFHSEDLAFDADGLAYVRTEDIVARYNPSANPWREVPFDYGVDRPRVGYSPHATGRFARVTSGIEMPSVKPGYWIMGGICVSPSGSVAVACHNPGQAARRSDEVVVGEVTTYKPPIYPGRPIGWEVHVWDKHGKLLHADALPGCRQVFGLGMDHAGDLYVMTPGRRMIDGKPYPNDASCVVFKSRPGAAKFVAGGWDVPVPLEGKARPDFPPQISHGLYGGPAWILDALWLYGGAGNQAKFVDRAGGGCWCQYTSMHTDDYGRCFVPEPDLYSVAVLDPAGNLVVRIGHYGNADDGVPLIAAAAPPHARSIGGDEVAFFDPQHPSVDTDRRLFVSDIGNARVVSVKLDYYATARVALKDVPDAGATTP